MSQSIQPLRIQKSTPASSPNKINGTAVHRPLAELGPSERRRNSPSYNQASKKPLFQADSSPFDSSPFANSPRLYWQSREPGSPTRNNVENRDPRDSSPAPAKRSSIENLKRASRVKNSTMFAREQKYEYDPTSSPMIERPLASGRPLKPQTQGSTAEFMKLENFHIGHAQEMKTDHIQSPTKAGARASMPNYGTSPGRALNSPTKSSLSSKTRYGQHHAFDPEGSIWSDEEDSIAERQLPPGKGLHRHAKSVTFDVAPPQVNEYEQATPDPSSVASGSREGSHDSFEDEDESFEAGESIGPDESFDASLEDTEKTPVVLPDDWRFMSPDNANDELTARFEDPFNERHGSPNANARPSSAVDARTSPVRTDSADSNGERRPLPPLPASNARRSGHSRTESRTSLSGIVDRLDHGQRQAASPPRPASITKSEIHGMTASTMSLEERVKLMMIDDEARKNAAEDQRDRRLRRASPTRSPQPNDDQRTETTEAWDQVDDLADLDLQQAPRISRESILRKVKGRSRDRDEEQVSNFMHESSYGTSLETLDPDVPLPTTESIDDDPPFVKRENDDESEVDLYKIPDLYNKHLEAESFMCAIDKLEAIKRAQEEERYQTSDSRLDEDEEGSHYSDQMEADEQSVAKLSPAGQDHEGLSTPKASTGEMHRDDQKSHRMSLPQFAALLGESRFDFGMESFMSEAQTTHTETVRTETDVQTPKGELLKNEATLTYTEIERPVTPDAQLDPPKFPGLARSSTGDHSLTDSVIHHSVPQSPAPESPGVPEPVATIKASGSKLKTRQSATPADIQAMADVRRQASGEVPAVPKIPSQHLQDRPASCETAHASFSAKYSQESNETTQEEMKQQKRKSSLTPLDLQVESSDGLGIESEFDRLLEAQKVVYHSPGVNSTFLPWSPGRTDRTAGRFLYSKDQGANGSLQTQKGYLMRQNTKMIVASSASHESNDEVRDGDISALRETKSAGNSPRKPPQTQTWTTEPWNGKIRRKSIRKSGGIPSKPASGPVPPLPGQQSNITAGLDSVAENEAADGSEEIGEDGERGRLFVQVVRVKDLDLPLPRGERSYFALTLDNGVHCVTTSWLELGKTAPIGQEFELVVQDDLEFQLTLQTKIEEPKPKSLLESPTKAAKAAKSSAFSRVFASPKKRREMELRQQEEAQRADRQKQQDLQSRRAPQSTAWELLHNLVAKDGSFARAYVSLKDHESSAYGKPFSVDVPCFNEWAIEEAQNGSSARSKRTGGVLRKAPYRIGKIELKLFYVPKPKGAIDDEMPKSMNACMRELKDAQTAGPARWEGHLSQQGGDCPYWRRRYFSLDGPKFTAYHEATRQPRATINLAKASKLIDDKSALMKPGKGSRRKSAFAEEEEGYMFVEEGFRIRFGNGEVIDFYADSAADKDNWMKALCEVVGKDAKKKAWTDLVIERHQAVASRAQQAMEGKIRPPSPTKPAPQSPNKNAPFSKSSPPTPAKSFAPRNPPMPVPAKNPRRSDVAIANRRAEAASKTRSMIF